MVCPYMEQVGRGSQGYAAGGVVRLLSDGCPTACSPLRSQRSTATADNFTRHNDMKTYVMTTGAIFGLLVLIHIWRMVVETHLATEPGYIVVTLLAALLSLWAARLLWRSRSV